MKKIEISGEGFFFKKISYKIIKNVGYESKRGEGSGMINTLLYLIWW